MGLDWQNILALVVVGVAIGYAARRVWRAVALKKVGRCGGCTSCPTPDDRRPLVSLDPPGNKDNSTQ